MHNAILTLRSSFKRIRDLGGLHQAVSSLTTKIIDPSDLLRAQIVMTASALDFYIHEITRLGMLEVSEGRRPSTNAFRKFKIALHAPMDGFSGVEGWLDAEIRERHSFLSFQMPDKIADAIRLFSDVSLWDTVASDMRGRPKT